ncbi:MAG: hypothetical protein H7Y33_03495 [Cytophagales bacterium]|nr:hypothetical protein [Rhizobacter sp.]
MSTWRLVGATDATAQREWRRTPRSQVGTPKHSPERLCDVTMRSEPQLAGSQPVAHHNRFTLQGSPSSLSFPPLCPNCGGAAAETIEYAKVFRRVHTDAPTEHIVTSVRVPMCSQCAALHHQQAAPPSQLSKVLSSFATGDMLGAVLPAIAAVFVAYLALKELVKGRFDAFGIFVLVAAFFAVIAWSQRRHVWQATHHLRVAPATDMTQAFDFSDDIASAFESPRFICSMRDERFANAFSALNSELKYRADSASAVADRKQANRTMWLVGAVVVALALLGYLVG